MSRKSKAQSRLALTETADNRKDAVNQIVRLMSQGVPPDNVIEIAKKQWPTFSIEGLISDSLQAIVEAGEIDAAIVKGFISLGCREIYAKSFSEANFDVALKALKTLAAIHGL